MVLIMTSYFHCCHTVFSCWQ